MTEDAGLPGTVDPDTLLALAGAPREQRKGLRRSSGQASAAWPAGQGAGRSIRSACHSRSAPHQGQAQWTGGRRCRVAAQALVHCTRSGRPAGGGSAYHACRSASLRQHPAGQAENRLAFFRNFRWTFPRFSLGTHRHAFPVPRRREMAEEDSSARPHLVCVRRSGGVARELSAKLVFSRSTGKPDVGGDIVISR